MSNNRSYRESLGELSLYVEGWIEKLRQAHLDAIFVDEDWMQSQSSASDWHVHLTYRREYWREVFLSIDPSAILFDDETNCHSALLNLLKSERLQKYGKVENLQSEWKTRPLIELSFPRRKLCLSNERGSLKAIEEWSDRHNTFLRRYESTRSHYSKQLQEIIKQVNHCTSENKLQVVFACYLKETLQKYAAEMRNVDDQGGEIISICFAINDCDFFVLNPIVSIYENNSAKNVFRGKVYVPFRIMASESFKMPFTFERDEVIYQSKIISFDAYEHFSSLNELALSIVTYGVFLSVVVPDLLGALKRGKSGFVNPLNRTS
jgi:hypothetical protein